MRENTLRQAKHVKLYSILFQAGKTPLIDSRQKETLISASSVPTTEQQQQQQKMDGGKWGRGGGINDVDCTWKVKLSMVELLAADETCKAIF